MGTTDSVLTFAGIFQRPAWNQGALSHAHWIYWEIGLLSALWALWSTPVEKIDHSAYGIVAFLFMWGLVR